MSDPIVVPGPPPPPPPTAKSLLQGNPFGQVWPPRPAPPLPAVDARTTALRVLADYISELTFNRVMEETSKPEGFQIKREHIFVEQPDNVQNLPFPSVVFVPGPGDYSPIGLTAFIDESTADKYAPGTALQEQSEYVETVTIEVWANTRAMRRCIVAGLEVALVPTEQMYGIRFRMPDYFNQTVCFSLNTSMRVDDPEAVRNRRWAHLMVEMRFDMVALVNVSKFKPFVVTEPIAAGFPDLELEVTEFG